jgi:hypothetical protein
MKTHQKAILCLCLAVTIFQSCGETTSNDQQTKQQAVTEQTSEANAEYLFTSNAFYGITKNEKVPEGLEKSVLKTPDGDFDIYLIKDENGTQLGHILTHGDELEIGNITVTSPKAITPQGFRVGMTFNELQKKYPNLEVHGSETEGYTYAKVEDIFYNLDFNHWEYELDAKLIPANTKIISLFN